LGNQLKHCPCVADKPKGNSRATRATFRKCIEMGQLPHLLEMSAANTPAISGQFVQGIFTPRRAVWAGVAV
jgi:hypothetical protein